MYTRTCTHTCARARACVYTRVCVHDRARDARVAGGKGVGSGYLGGRRDRSGQTDVPTSAGTPKTRQRRRRRRRRETRNPRTPSGQVFDCPACGGLRREAGTGISRWKLICRDGKYRRRRTVSSWKYVARYPALESRYGIPALVCYVRFV